MIKSGLFLTLLYLLFEFYSILAYHTASMWLYLLYLTIGDLPPL